MQLFIFSGLHLQAFSYGLLSKEIFINSPVMTHIKILQLDRVC